MHFFQLFLHFYAKYNMETETSENNTLMTCFVFPNYYLYLIYYSIYFLTSVSNSLMFFLMVPVTLDGRWFTFTIWFSSKIFSIPFSVSMNIYMYRENFEQFDKKIWKLIKRKLLGSHAEVIFLDVLHMGWVYDWVYPFHVPLWVVSVDGISIHIIIIHTLIPIKYHLAIYEMYV